MDQFEEIIGEEAFKLIRRHEEYARHLAEENVRRARRSVAPPRRLKVFRPAYWTLAPGFDPYKVRAHVDRIAFAIRQALRDRRYTPRNPTAFAVPKADGTLRGVSVFQVADSAVSTLVFTRLLEKNRPKLSARSYAYRSDLTVHDALQHLEAEFGRKERLFVAEYDFSKYFDSISHEHVLRVLRDERFLLTKTEQLVIRSFLRAPVPNAATPYTEFGGAPREFGVPQGTSISLFLANVAAAPLDRALEGLGVGFVRYADDTVIWSSDYGQICRAVDELHDIAKRMGAELNPEKSEGVRLLVGPRMKAELPKTTHIDFVGYQAGLRVLEMKETTEARARRHLQRLLYYNLLHEPLRGTQHPSRLAGRVDRDYVVFIWQARRYLYGDLSESELRRYQARGAPLRRFKGLMSFYPLLNDTERLRKFDQWLAVQTYLTMRRRARRLRAAGFTELPPPLELSLNELIRYTRTSATTGGTLDLRLPSLRRISNVVQRAARQHGPNRVGRGRSMYDY